MKFCRKTICLICILFTTSYSHAQLFKKKVKKITPYKVESNTDESRYIKRVTAEADTVLKNYKEIKTAPTNKTKPVNAKPASSVNKNDKSNVIYKTDEEYEAPPPPQPIKNTKNLSIKERLKKRQEENNSRIDNYIEQKINEKVELPEEVEVVAKPIITKKVEEPKPIITKKAEEPIYTSPSTIPLQVKTNDDDKAAEEKANKKLEELLLAETLKESKNNAAKNLNPLLWKLDQCIHFAYANNLRINESELNSRLASLMLQQNKASRLPNIALNGNAGKLFGRSIDPYTNTIAANPQDINFSTLGATSNVLLFGWFQKKYLQQQSEYGVLAANASHQQLKNDIALNITTGYLRILLQRELTAIQQQKIKTVKDITQKAKKNASNNKLFDINQATLDAQLNTDSATYLIAKNEENNALLQLKAIMNVDFEKSFDIIKPNINAIDYYSEYKLPEAKDIYDIAYKNHAQIKANQYQLYASNKAMAVAKSSRYPQLNLNANAGTVYTSTYSSLISQRYAGTENIGFVNIGETLYPLTQNKYENITQINPLMDQYKNNLFSNAALSLSMPLLNGRYARTNIERAKIAYVSEKIALDNNALKLKQDIYKTYDEAKTLLQTYNASLKSKTAAQKALELAGSKFESGAISVYDYTNTLNQYTKISSAVLTSKYELLFALKMLDYYMGNPLKL